MENPFKWRHYQSEIILLSARGYLRYALSYRDVDRIFCNIAPIDTSIKYKRISPLLSKKPLKSALFVDDWDDLLRVAASLKMGWVTASTFITNCRLILVSIS